MTLQFQRAHTAETHINAMCRLQCDGWEEMNKVSDPPHLTSKCKKSPAVIFRFLSPFKESSSSRSPGNFRNGSARVEKKTLQRVKNSSKRINHVLSWSGLDQNQQEQSALVLSVGMFERKCQLS